VVGISNGRLKCEIYGAEEKIAEYEVSNNESGYELPQNS
jgi:hypothetical protein